MLSLHKTFLMLIFAWCILVILKGFVINRGLHVMRVVIHVRGHQDLIEPIVRCLKLEFEMAGLDTEIMLQSDDGGHEYCKVIGLLVKDGVLAPARHLKAPDLVLYLGKSQAVY